MNKRNYSNKIHKSRTRLPSYTSASLSKKVVLTVIIVVFFIVIGSVISSFLLKPERLTKIELETLATDYYENYFYDNLLNLSVYKTDEELRAGMEKYERRGFSPISLRHLLLYYRDSSFSTSNLQTYCDENRTSVIIFPEYPYSKTSYRVEYSYTCNF